jgi:hypothetical protein
MGEASNDFESLVVVDCTYEAVVADTKSSRPGGDSVLGSGRELDGELIQLSAFRAEDGGRRLGRVALPSRRR